MTDASSPDEHLTALRDHLDAVNRGEAILTVFATCEVEYEGRASGYVGPGDRVILCKPDGTLLVHRPSGADPVNWQPPGSTFLLEDDADEVVLTARRSSPEEIVRVYLPRIHDVKVYEADDTAPLQLSGTEAEMHEYLLANPDEIESDLRILEHERDSPFGTIDLFANDAAGRPVVIEVKRRRATLNHVDQLRRYMDEYRETNPDARGILVAPTASEKVKRALREHDLEFCGVEEFSTTSTVSSTTISDFGDATDDGAS